ncbi:hypothetical protein V8C42DRAFT_361243 [Trichoderma barbatum]
MAHNRLLYLAEQHCFLCRNELHYHSSIAVLMRKPLTWEKAVVGFFDLSLDPSQGPQASHLKTDLDDDHFIIDPAFSLMHEGVKKTVAIYHKPPRSRYRPFFVAHELCCRAIQSLQGNINCNHIYDIAIKTQGLLPKDCWAEAPPTRLASFPGTIETGIVDIENTSLGACILRCSRLPPELQNYIMEYLRGDTLVYSLMAALQTFTDGRRHALATIPNHPSIRKVLHGDHVEVAHVSGSFISFFGSSYLTGINIFHNQDHRDTLGHKCIEMELDSVRQIEFIIGMYGIAAVRFYFDDASVSDWLGDGREGWRCKPIDVTRSDLAFPTNDRNALVQRFAELLAQAPEDAPLNVLWDGSCGPFHDGISLITDYYTEMHCVRPSPFPGRPMCRYLPLHIDGQHATGITVYVYELGMSGIIVHGKTTHYEASVPDRKGQSWTFHFKKGEEIVTLGMVTYGYRSRRNGPYLLFKTSHDRIAYFGPPTSLLEGSTGWVSLIPEHLDKKCSVMGLIVDQMAISFGCFRTIGARLVPKEGVTINHEALNSPSEHDVRLPNVPSSTRQMPFKTGGFMTRANLSSIKQLRVLAGQAHDMNEKLVYRCRGLWILHKDGSIETLGSWDGSLIDEAKLIYDDTTDGNLTKVIFQFRKGKNIYTRPEEIYYVANIATRVMKHEGVDEYRDEEGYRTIPNSDRVIEYGLLWPKTLVWCFTEAADLIEGAPSDSRSYIVPPNEDCKLLQIKQL